MGEQQNSFEDTFLAAILNQMGTNSCATDVETDEILHMNKTTKETPGLTRPEGRVCWQVLQKDMKERCPYYKIRQMEQVGDNKICVWCGTSSVAGKKYRNYDNLIQQKGKAYHIQNFMDMTKYGKTSETARTGELTRMLNRRGGSRHPIWTLEQGSRENQVMTAVLYDINELKSVNNRYGHGKGDRLLQYVAAITREYLGRLDFMYCLGNDEFVMAFYRWNMEAADESMKRLLIRAGQERKRQLQEYDVSFGYGIVEVCPGDMGLVEDTIPRADKQMYIQRREHYMERAKRRPREKHEDRDTPFYYGGRSLYETLSTSMDDYIFVGNIEIGVFCYPQIMVEEFSLSGQVVREAVALWGQLIHPHDEACSLKNNQSIVDEREEYHNIEYRTRNVGEEQAWLRRREGMLRDKDEQPKLLTSMVSNLSKKDQIDHMTGLHDKYEFEKNTKKYLAGRKRMDTIGLMVLNMDSFKNINDLYNRFFGDEALRIMAQKVASMLPPNVMLYRLDGDGSSILLLGGDTEEAAHLFDKLQQSFCGQQEYGGKKYFYTLSVGYAVYPEDGGNYLELFKRVNYSLEYSRIMEKNRMTVLSGNTLADRERRLGLMELLYENVERGFAGFSVHYQPQTDTLSDRLYGVEALARWHCGKCGDVSLGEFIPLMEQSGLIMPFGQRILNHDMTQCLERYRSGPDFQIGVNLSYPRPSQGGFVSSLRTAPEENSPDPPRFIMELTETYLAKAEMGTLRLITQMKEPGVRIAMGDFGAGYSPLSSLKSIPMDMVKTDRRFVKGITSDPFNAIFVQPIIGLCYDVSRKICLKGVETKKEYEVVGELGMEYIQGYYLGRPMSARRFEDRPRE